MDYKTPLNASKIILELGVAIPVRTPGFFRRKGKPWTVVMRTPTYGTLIRIAGLYLSMRVKYEQFKDYTLEENLKFYYSHGKTMSRMVAYSIVPGLVSGRILNRIVAWLLRWFVHPVMLQEAWFQMLTLLDVKSFHDIIRSAAKINLMAPRLSHK
jgi:hypothetical protein